MRAFFCLAWILSQALSSILGNSIYQGMPEAKSLQIAPEDNPHPQDQGTAKDKFSFKVSVNLVTIDVTVHDKRGTLIGDLQPEDFVVYDNGVAQQVTCFSHAEFPLAIALVIDRSPSIAPYLTALHNAAQSALQLLKPGDEVALYGFADDPSLLCDLTQDFAQIARVISLMGIRGGMTNINDAIFNAAQYLHARAPDRRHAIILISDNYPSARSLHNDAETLRETLEAATTLYSIRTPGENLFHYLLTRPIILPPNMGSPQSVGRYARETGGEVLDVGAKGKLSNALDAAILDLRQGYVLGFIPSSIGADGSQHLLSVKIREEKRCPGCRVQARSGYYAASTAPSLQPPGTVEIISLDPMKESFPQMIIRAAASNSSEQSDISFKVSTAVEPNAALQKGVTLQSGVGASK
jgi:VWFA-related protein